MSAPAPGEGFFWCSRCKAVVELSEQAVDLALSLPAGRLVKLKCPGCHHHSVEWKRASVERPRTSDGRIVKPPIPQMAWERCQELWAKAQAEHPVSQ